MANRGAPEVEALPANPADPENWGGTASLALTLVRAVGWLSRGDLAMRPGHAGPPVATPGAQMQCDLHAEFSYRLHPAGDGSRAAQAHRFAFPPIAFAAGEPDGTLHDGARLVEVDEPSVVVSAIEPLADGTTGLRVVNLSADARKLNLRWNGAGGAELRAVDLTGRRVENPAAATGTELGPWRIATFRTASS